MNFRAITPAEEKRGRAGKPRFAGRFSGRGERDCHFQPPGDAIAGFGQVFGERWAPDGSVGVQGGRCRGRWN